MITPTPLSWLTRPHSGATTWGVPWPRGTVAAGSPFGLRVAGRPVPVQTWVTARWPDGSIKWTGHAATVPADPAGPIELLPGTAPAAPEPGVRVIEDPESILVDSGVARWRVPRSGAELITEIHHDGRPVGGPVALVSLWQDAPADDGRPGVRTAHHGLIETLTVEQAGPVRAVLRMTGRHGDPANPAGSRDGRGPWLPFTVRLEFRAGSGAARLVHSVIFDGAPDRDFLAGLGIRVAVGLSDPLPDRHIRLAGPADPAGRPGFLTEAVRGLTGLRRDPGPAVREAQLAGRPTPPATDLPPEVGHRLRLVPAWSDWTLDQLCADGFRLVKRTAPDRPWVTIPAGTRAAGYGYLGGATGGGIGLGLRDFWRLHPTRLDVRDATGPRGSLTAWLWSPSTPAMDLRFYHDGLGQDTYAEQLEGLEITYEDYEPRFGTAHGIARTHELLLDCYPATPDHDTLTDRAAELNDPPLLRATPARIRAAGVFGDWAPRDRSTPARAAIEDRLDRLVDYYRGQVEDRRWYGFFDYGDVMHSYDADRHQWRYDVGGYAWDNSELSPDLWLWTQFLRTGDAEVFRLAEAMTRHTGEVDVYHLGPWRGLGTRHNVQHWGCSAKQLRISSAVYRRIFYYLTADERTGDLLDELAEPEQTFLALDPTRKVRTDRYTPDPGALAVGLGTDYSALAAAWLTRWERYGDPEAQAKLLGTMADIGALPNGFLTGEALFDLATGRLDPARDQISVSHLSAVFGLVEICSELIMLTHGTELARPDFERAWLQYCRLYLAPPEQQRAEVGQALRGISLIQAHSRLTAWAAHRTGDPNLTRRAWREFFVGAGDQLNTNPMQHADWTVRTVSGPQLLARVRECPVIGTNGAAQYALAAIQNLALLGEPPPTTPESP